MNPFHDNNLKHPKIEFIKILIPRLEDMNKKFNSCEIMTLVAFLLEHTSSIQETIIHQIFTYLGFFCPHVIKMLRISGRIEKLQEIVEI